MTVSMAIVISSLLCRVIILTSYIGGILMIVPVSVLELDIDFDSSLKIWVKLF